MTLDVVVAGGGPTGLTLACIPAATVPSPSNLVPVG
jgi:NADH dehydrogenase FAD-containing subunit